MKSARVLLVFVLVLLGNSYCRPNTRIKRVSDQRLAELNTKIGLSQLKGQIVTIPMAHGKLDPTKIAATTEENFTRPPETVPTGRRRRAQSSLLALLMNPPQDDNAPDEISPDFITYEDSYRR